MKTILNIIKTTHEKIKENRFIFLSENTEQNTSYFLDQASASIVKINRESIYSWIHEKEHFNPIGMIYIMDEVFFQLFEDNLIPQANSLNQIYKENYLHYVLEQVDEMQEKVRQLRYAEHGIFAYYCSVFDCYDQNFSKLSTIKEKANYFLTHDDLTEELKKIFIFFYTNEEPIFIKKQTELNQLLINNYDSLISSHNFNKLTLINEFIPKTIYDKIFSIYHDIEQLFQYKQFKNIDNLLNIDQLLNIQIEFILCLNEQKNSDFFLFIVPILKQIALLIEKEKNSHLEILFKEQEKITTQLEEALKKK